MNSYVTEMLSLLDRLNECQSELTKEECTEYYFWADREEKAKEEFENALVSLIDERIKLFIGE